MEALLLGLATGIGLLLGLCGGGGSILSVPLLHYVGGLDTHESIAGSLLVVGTSSAAAALLHARAGRVHMRTALLFGASGMTGAFVGGRLSSLIPAPLLVFVFASVMVAAALTTLRRQGLRATGLPVSPRADAFPTVPLARMLLFGGAVGGLAGLVGAGGGFLIVPALLLLGLPLSKAVGTSLAVISLQSFAGFAAHAGQVELHWPVLLGVTAATVAGSAIGHRAISMVPAHLVRRGFAFLVLAIAAVMLLREVPQSIEAGSMIPHGPAQNVEGPPRGGGPAVTAGNRLPGA